MFGLYYDGAYEAELLAVSSSVESLESVARRHLDESYDSLDVLDSVRAVSDYGYSIRPLASAEGEEAVFVSSYSFIR